MRDQQPIFPNFAPALPSVALPRAIPEPPPVAGGAVSISTVIRLANPSHLPFIVSLQKRFTDELGFLPAAALEWYAGTGNCRIALENGQPAGYLLGRPRFRWQPLLRPITQAAICYDAHRRHHGLALVELVAAQAIADKQRALQVMCAADIEANEFWKAAGFVEVTRYSPENTRGREMICWRRSITGTCPQWFWQLPPRAGWKAKVTHENAPDERTHANDPKAQL